MIRLIKIVENEDAVRVNRFLKTLFTRRYIFRSICVQMGEMVVAVIYVHNCTQASELIEECGYLPLSDVPLAKTMFPA